MENKQQMTWKALGWGSILQGMLRDLFNFFFFSFACLCRLPVFVSMNYAALGFVV